MKKRIVYRMCVYMFNKWMLLGLVRWILVQLNLDPLQYSLLKYILYLWHRTWTTICPPPSHLLQSSVSSVSLIPVQDMTPLCALQLVWERKALQRCVLLLHLLYFVIILINYYDIDKLKKGALRTECVPPVAEKKRW